MLRTARRRLACGVAAVVALCCAAAASSTASQGRSLVALGDSVPRGTNCDCRPYPSLTAAGLTTSSRRLVTATNDSVAGYTTSNVLRQLRSDESVIDHVRRADVIEIEIGANDVAFSKSCGASVACYAPRIPVIERNLTAIVGRVRSLTSGHRALVVLLDYWSVWLGGRYAKAQGPAYVAAAEAVTDRVNAVIRSTAAKSGSSYVDLRAAFKGPNYAYDETRFLSNDGDHPNAAGHRRIAAAAETVIERALHLS
jgi:lysophospholipase L1-like esterase